MCKINIAIDGFAACGKSSTARAVAQTLEYIYIDSGAMYRAFTLYLIRAKIDVIHNESLEKVIDEILPLVHIDFDFDPILKQNQTVLNGERVEQAIRSLEVSEVVSEVSANAKIRKRLVEQQRKLGVEKGVVMDGRDVGTVVFPDAELKIFMIASLEARIERRKLEAQIAGYNMTEDEIRKNLQHRDELDATRTESPLRQAEDAYVLDTTTLTFQEQVDKILSLAKERMTLKILS